MMSYFNKVYDMWVEHESINVDPYSFEGSADNLKTTIDNVVAKATAKGMVNDGYFDISGKQDYYGNGYEVVIKYEFVRRENDKERTTREKVELIAKANTAEKRKAALAKKKLKSDPEYVEFERLKAKFEKN